MRIAPQAGQFDHAISAQGGAREQRTFPAARRAGDEGYLVAACVQAGAGQQRVFLGAADNQTCNDMDDSQQAPLKAVRFQQSAVSFLAAGLQADGGILSAGPI